MKRCFKCGLTKELAHFYKHKQMLDGHLGKCKDCTRADMKRFRREQPERARAIEARKKGKHYMINRVSALMYVSPEQRAAHIVVGNAVRAKRLVKSPCRVCGTSRVEGHHEDYTKPLDVIWLCPTHHRRLHAGDFTAQDITR